MLTKNWKTILNINNKDVIFVYDNTSRSVSKSIIDGQEIIKADNENYYVFPILSEIIEKDKAEIIKKYANDFKMFITKQEKKFLVTHDVIFNSLVKDEKQKDFIDLILKNKKQIMIVSAQKTEEINEVFCGINYDEWQNSLNVIEKFKDIKRAFKKTFNPFKDPKQAFLKYKEN
jgi:hypothetical protein